MTPRIVRGWPTDRAAAEALADWAGREPPDESNVTVDSLLDGSDLNFVGADLSGLDLSEADLIEAILTNVALVGTDLYGAWVQNADFSGADLSMADLRKVKGRHCRAVGAVFRGAQFGRAEFERVDFRNADLRDVKFGRSLFTGADFRHADLRGCVFSSTYLRQARVAGVLFEGASGTITGPLDVGDDTAHLIDGEELQAWLTDHGAPHVVVEPSPPRTPS